jgi:hypothetical protein
MAQLSCNNIRTSHRWALTCSESDDPSIILRDSRGGKRRKAFYDILPEIELSARAYEIEETSKKIVNLQFKSFQNSFQANMKI